jgi:hypothetical protein
LEVLFGSNPNTPWNTIAIFLAALWFFLEPKQKRALKVYCCTYVQ